MVVWDTTIGGLVGDQVKFGKEKKKLKGLVQPIVASSQDLLTLNQSVFLTSPQIIKTSTIGILYSTFKLRKIIHYHNFEFIKTSLKH